ncbi:MAG: Crp/Fnr family transcriptional regulator [Bacteroidota bacterium]
MPYSHFLHHAFPPENFPPEELQTVLEAFDPMSYQKRDFLQRAGQISGHYFFIESGYARAYVIDPSGQEVSTNFFTRGDIVIDWQSFMLRQPGQEQIQALTDLRTWRIDFTRFNELFHQIQPFREGGRSRFAGSYFALKRHQLSLITETAKDRYLRLIEEKPGLLQHIPLKHIASYLGITDSSLSRLRKEISQT